MRIPQKRVIIVVLDMNGSLRSLSMWQLIRIRVADLILFVKLRNVIMEIKEVLIGTKEELVEHFLTFVKPYMGHYHVAGRDNVCCELKKTIKEQLKIGVLKKRELFA